MIAILAVLLASFNSVYAAGEDVSVQLKAAISDSARKLGELDPWQKKLFDEEAVPQYQRFIRDYRPAPGGRIQAEVDLDALKNYLKFYAPKSLQRDGEKVDLKALIYLMTDESCERCQASAAVLRALVKSRIERRGLVPMFLAPTDLGERAGRPPLAAKAVDEKVSTLTKERGASAAMVIQFAPAPIDDIDSAHADEKRFFVRSFLRVRDVQPSEGRMELMENDPFEPALARLLTDAFTDIGARLGELGVNKGIEKAEVLVDVSGFGDFQQYNQVKSRLQSELKGIVSVEERRVAKGRVTLAVVTGLSRDEVANQISALKIEKVVLEVR